MKRLAAVLVIVSGCGYEAPVGSQQAALQAEPVDDNDAPAAKKLVVPAESSADGNILWDGLRSPERALDIGIGANGDVWLIDGDHRIGKWSWVSPWQLTDGGADRIAVDPKGVPWVVNGYHNIFYRRGSAWVQVSGGATDIGVGANGDVWVIGGEGRAFRYRAADNGWDMIADGRGFQRIAVASDGSPWVTDSGGNVFHREANRWEFYPGLATDIGVGKDGRVWIVGYDGEVHNIVAPSGARQWRTDALAPDPATNVAVDPDGRPWVVRSSGKSAQGVGGNCGYEGHACCAHSFYECPGQLDCYNGTCFNSHSWQWQCEGAMVTALALGGGDPIGCIGSPPCWGAWARYNNLGCNNHCWCYSLSCATSFVDWAGGHCGEP